MGVQAHPFTNTSLFTIRGGPSYPVAMNTVPASHSDPGVSNRPVTGDRVPMPRATTGSVVSRSNVRLTFPLLLLGSRENAMRTSRKASLRVLHESYGEVYLR